MTAAPHAAQTAARAPVDLFSAKAAVYGPRLMADFGLTAAQAAGIFGNIGHECGGFRIMQEIKPTVAGSRGGFGWCQWTGPRRLKFEAYCARNGLDPVSDAANYAYLFVELKGDEFPAILAVKKTATLAEATDAFCRTFERPGVVALSERMSWATKALAAVRGAPPAVPIPVVVAQPVPAPVVIRDPEPPAAAAPIARAPTVQTGGFWASLKSLFTTPKKEA